MCVLIFPYSFCLINFSFYEEFSDILSRMYSGTHVRYPLFLQHFNETSIFSTNFQKLLKSRIFFTQSEPSYSKRTAGQLDKTKLTVAFRNFANASKNFVGSGSSGMRRRVVGRLFPRRLEGTWCLLLQLYWTSSPTKWTLRSSETSKAAHPETQLHSAAEMNPMEQHCVNLKTGNQNDINDTETDEML